VSAVTRRVSSRRQNTRTAPATIGRMDTAGSFAAAFAALYAAHEIGDHWLQRHSDALSKGEPGRTGRHACARHVATLTATKAAALAATSKATGLRLRPRAVLAALAVDAVSHYWADRRTTLARLAGRTGKAEFYALGDGKAAPCGTGAYALDQSWHVGFLFVASLVIATDHRDR
jgi:hypothetical protein